MSLRLTTFMAVGLLAGTAMAAPLRDSTTGLTVDPPPGYVAKHATPGQRQAARISVQRPQDTELGCQVAYSPAPQNAGMSQQDINAAMASEAWQSAARRALSMLYDLSGARTVDYGLFRAVMMQGSFKPRPDLPPRAQQITTFFGLMETPRGRTHIVCIAEKADFPQRRPEFEAVVRGVTPP